jgi:hypothetical protein
MVDIIDWGLSISRLERQGRKVKVGKLRKARSRKAKESLLWRFLWFNEGKETGVKCVF